MAVRGLRGIRVDMAVCVETLQVWSVYVSFWCGGRWFLSSNSGIASANATECNEKRLVVVWRYFDLNGLFTIKFAQILSKFVVFSTSRQSVDQYCCFSFWFSLKGRLNQLFINKFGFTFPLRRNPRKVSFATSFDHRSGPADANVVVGLSIVVLV